MNYLDSIPTAFRPIIALVILGMLLGFIISSWNKFQEKGNLRLIIYVILGLFFVLVGLFFQDYFYGVGSGSKVAGALAWIGLIWFYIGTKYERNYLSHNFNKFKNYIGWFVTVTSAITLVIYLDTLGFKDIRDLNKLGVLSLAASFSKVCFGLMLILTYNDKLSPANKSFTAGNSLNNNGNILSNPILVSDLASLEKIILKNYTLKNHTIKHLGYFGQGVYGIEISKRNSNSGSTLKYFKCEEFINLEEHSFGEKNLGTKTTNLNNEVTAPVQNSDNSKTDSNFDVDLNKIKIDLQNRLKILASKIKEISSTDDIDKEIIKAKKELELKRLKKKIADLDKKDN